MMMLISPGIVTDGPSMPKDVVLVLDTSGSMEGEKLGQARKALDYVLENLAAEDRFAVVEFSTGVRIFDDQLLPVSAVPGATRWVSRLEATGGTDIDGALARALRLVDNERPTFLLLLTDGVPTEGETDIGTIIENVSDRAPAMLASFRSALVTMSTPSSSTRSPSSIMVPPRMSAPVIRSIRPSLPFTAASVPRF